jgi:glutamate---cysteine ligase / carboxylate-amine ligase
LRAPTPITTLSEVEGRLGIRTDRSWAHWKDLETSYTVGVEEEVMLLEFEDMSLAQRSDEVIRDLSPELAEHARPETYAGVLELMTAVHPQVAGVIWELGALRRQLASELRGAMATAACAGMYPLRSTQEMRISGTPRYRLIADTMRCLAHEPTMALHVHVAVAAPDDATRVLRRIRNNVPLLVALAANSPFAQGAATGFASTRTVTFDRFPRTGPPPAFGSYDKYVEAIDPLIASGALPDSTFLWWDVRLRPSFGTVEVRAMDAQSTIAESASLVALIQSLARLELEGPPDEAVAGDEVLEENRFLAARDGLDARLIDPVSGRLTSARTLLTSLINQCRPHAAALGCSAELDGANRLVAANGALRQRTWTRAGHDLISMVSRLSRQFTAPQVRPRSSRTDDARGRQRPKVWPHRVTSMTSQERP